MICSAVEMLRNLNLGPPRDTVCLARSKNPAFSKDDVSVGSDESKLLRDGEIRDGENGCEIQAQTCRKMICKNGRRCVGWRCGPSRGKRKMLDGEAEIHTRTYKHKEMTRKNARMSGVVTNTAGCNGRKTALTFTVLGRWIVVILVILGNFFLFTSFCLTCKRKTELNLVALGGLNVGSQCQINKFVSVINE